jgi:hypothetical protein
MKKLRILLVLTGMLVTLPTFAAPPCSHCNTDIMRCEPDAPATGIVCRDTDCQERHVNCIPAFSPQLAQDLTIASVEVVTPAKHTVTTGAKTVRVAAAKLR